VFCRYNLRTSLAILVTLVLVCVVYAVITVLLLFTAVRVQQKLPFYQAQFFRPLPAIQCVRKYTQRPVREPVSNLDKAYF
jgi:hypothetical protein